MNSKKFDQIWLMIWPYLFFIVCITIMAFPQLMAGVVTKGGDTYFHYTRFYDTAKQIRNHNFSIFQSNYGFENSGRVVNTLYGPGFAYLNGLIVLLSKNWFNYQIITDYLVCFIGASSMFYLLKYVKVNRTSAAILSVLYINIGLIPTYLNGVSFNSWGQALMPFVLLCGIRMIKDHKNPINFVQLMLIISIFAQIHVLSTLMAIILLIPFFLLGVYLTKDKKSIWQNFFKAVLGTILLTANVWGAYLVLLSRNKLASPDPFNMAYSGLRITGYHLYYGSYGTVFGLVLPIIATLFLFQLIWVLFHLKDNLINSVVTIWGSILFGIASIYFPWGFVQRIFPFLQNIFQFPFRLTAIIYPMLIVGIALTIQNYFLHSSWKKILSYAFVVLVIVESMGSVIRTTNYYSENKIVRKYSRNDNLSEFFKNKIYSKQLDYIAVTKNIDMRQAREKYKHDVLLQSKYFGHSVKAGKMILTWNGKSNKEVILPVVSYAQSQIQVNNKNVNGEKTAIGSPIVKQRKGRNFASLSFKIPAYYYLLLLIAVISWLAVIGYLLYQKFIFKRANI